MTMTGESIGQREISDDQSLLNNLVERYFKQEELPETFIGNNITNKSNLDDEDVINIMLKSKQKDKISNLLQGNYEPYFDSPSEAVQSLLHYLAFYTSKDKEQMERIFLNYNNLTDKWGSKRGNTTWGQLELDKAINNQSEVYVKPGKENPSKLIKKAPGGSTLMMILIENLNSITLLWPNLFARNITLLDIQMLIAIFIFIILKLGFMN